jgi:hypothetical protein
MHNLPIDNATYIVYICSNIGRVPRCFDVWQFDPRYVQLAARLLFRLDALIVLVCMLILADKFRAVAEVLEKERFRERVPSQIRRGKFLRVRLSGRNFANVRKSDLFSAGIGVGLFRGWERGHF